MSEEASVQSRQWTEWSTELTIYFEAAGITAGKRKRALLLYFDGEVLRDIYESYEDTEKTFESTFTVPLHRLPSTGHYLFKMRHKRTLCPTVFKKGEKLRVTGA